MTLNEFNKQADELLADIPPKFREEIEKICFTELYHEGYSNMLEYIQDITSMYHEVEVG